MTAWMMTPSLKLCRACRLAGLLVVLQLLQGLALPVHGAAAPLAATHHLQPQADRPQASRPIRLLGSHELGGQARRFVSKEGLVLKGLSQKGHAAHRLPTIGQVQHTGPTQHTQHIRLSKYTGRHELLLPGQDEAHHPQQEQGSGGGGIQLLAQAEGRPHSSLSAVEWLLQALRAKAHGEVCSAHSAADIHSEAAHHPVEDRQLGIPSMMAGPYLGEDAQEEASLSVDSSGVLPHDQTTTQSLPLHLEAKLFTFSPAQVHLPHHPLRQLSGALIARRCVLAASGVGVSDEAGSAVVPEAHNSNNETAATGADDEPQELVVETIGSGNGDSGNKAEPDVWVGSSTAAGGRYAQDVLLGTGGVTMGSQLYLLVDDPLPTVITLP